MELKSNDLTFLKRARTNCSSQTWLGQYKRELETQMIVYNKTRISPEEWLNLLVHKDKILSIAHPNLVKVFGYFENVEGNLTLVHAAKNSKSFSIYDMNRKEIKFDSNIIEDIKNQITNAVRYMHQIGLVHGMLTSSNVFININGNKPNVQINIPTWTSGVKSDFEADLENMEYIFKYLENTKNNWYDEVFLTTETAEEKTITNVVVEKSTLEGNTNQRKALLPTPLSSEQKVVDRKNVLDTTETKVLLPTPLSEKKTITNVVVEKSTLEGNTNQKKALLPTPLSSEQKVVDGKNVLDTTETKVLLPTPLSEEKTITNVVVEKSTLESDASKKKALLPTPLSSEQKVVVGENVLGTIKRKVLLPTPLSSKDPRSIIMFNVPESSGSNGDLDSIKIGEIVKKGLNGREWAFCKVQRMGHCNTNTVRPVKVTMSTSEDCLEIIRNKYRLKNHEDTKEIKIYAFKEERHSNNKIRHADRETKNRRQHVQAAN